MDALNELAEAYSLQVIEDATESLGSLYRGRHTGGLGHIGCFSFNGNKIITSGGGGMVVTDNEETARRIRHLSTQAKSDPLEYDHDEIGYNYRLTNIQAALGLAQMERLEDYVAIKRKNAQQYRHALQDISRVRMLDESADVKSNFWFYTIKTERRDKQPLLQWLIRHGIQARSLWKPIHNLKMYSHNENFKIEQADEAYACCLNIPCSVNLSDEDIRYVAGIINRFFERPA
jgi:perosamine synthetase